MGIKRFVIGGFETNTYLITKGDKAVIVDPGMEFKSILDEIKNYHIEAILITHGHVDHILFLEQIVKHYNCKVYLTKHALEKVYNDNLNLSVLFNYIPFGRLCQFAVEKIPYSPIFSLTNQHYLLY